MNKFVIIDGNAILHRAFHALPPLNNKDGVLTNAVYGFFSMFLKIIQDVKPVFITVCFDRPKPTFRQALYVGYHAQRPKMDEGLVPQIGIVHEILEKAKIPVFEVDGYEADDLIGTLATQAMESKLELRKKKTKLQALNTNKLEVIIVSGDRDMLQLVNDGVKVLAPVIGITQMILFDKEKVLEKYKLTSGQIIDYKALVGDPSDNYPGVSGVGPKTAAELLLKYETLENLYRNLDSMENKKLAEKLAKDAEQAGLAKKLATIVTDAPINLDIEECSIKNLDKEGMREEFEKWGFKSLVNRLEGTKDAKDTKGTQETKETEEAKNESKQLGLL